MSAAALAADKQKQSAAVNKEDRAACMSQADQDQAACMREAAAARAEARRGRLDEGQSAAYEQNRLARCGYLPAADRQDCERRMRGEGTTSGSVAGGGIYRELRTIVPAEGDGEASAGK
jgi:hypothetical protein